MPICLPENNASTEPSNTRRSWLKMAGLGGGGGGGGGDGFRIFQEDGFAIFTENDVALSQEF